MSAPNTSVSVITQAWSAKSEVRAAVTVDMGEINVRICSDNPGLVVQLREYYADFIGEGAADVEIFAWESEVLPDPPGLGPFTEQQREGGKSGIKESFVRLADGVVVRKVRTGMLYAVGEATHHVKGPCLKNIAQVVNFANNRAIQASLRAGDLLGHASALVATTEQGERGVAFAGFSGMGKSTLALHLMAATKYSFVSNDRIMFGPRQDGVRMLGVAKHPRINPGTILHNPALHAISTKQDRDRWAALPTATLWDLEEKYDGLVESCFGPGRFRLSAPLHAFVVLNWKRDGQPPILSRVDLTERIDLLDAIRKSPGLFYAPAPGQAEYDGRVKTYLEALKNVAVYELSGGVDFDKAVKLVRSRVVEPQ